MEIDLSKFSQTVQSLGGLKGVIEKKRWQKVADAMKIPKSAQDRVTKLDDIYCQFLLAYDTLSASKHNHFSNEHRYYHHHLACR
jgi:protein Jumonji